MSTKISETIIGICERCGCQVTTDNVGFSDGFVVCKKCNREIEEDYDFFQSEMRKEENRLFS